MKRFFSVAAAAAIFCAIALPNVAQATVIDFETLDTSNAPFAALITDGDYVTQSGYFFQGQDPLNTSGVPDFALVGALVNGADPGTCLDGNCPAGNTTNYIAALNGSIISFGQLNGGNSILSSFDAAFVAPAGSDPTGLPAYLAIEADRSDGSYTVGVFALGAVGAGGTTAFQTYQTSNAQIIAGSGTLTSGNVTSLFAYAYYCDNVSCAAFQSNAGQFALDNLVLDDSVTAPLPEAATWAMMLAGFGAVGTALRRQRNQLPQTA